MKNMFIKPIQTQSPRIGQMQQERVDVKQANFSDQLQQALKTHERLTLSKHAKERLIERKININENRWSQIEDKVNEAKKMGLKESLVLLNDAALIISAKNNIVITAMDRQEAESQIFTNINGAIILD